MMRRKVEITYLEVHFACWTTSNGNCWTGDSSQRRVWRLNFGAGFSETAVIVVAGLAR
jgi:hypothetical protein